LDACKTLGAAEVIAVGTSALRDARNSLEVRQRWRLELGLDVRVIGGDDEAAYAFLAAQRGLPLTGEELLVIDIGGGSTEFIRGNDSGVTDALSLNLGSVRLTERFLRSDPVRAEEVADLTSAMDSELAELAKHWRHLAVASTWVGTAGTFTTMAAVEKQLTRYSHSVVHGSHLTHVEVQRQVQLYRSRTLAERKTIPGLEPKRADVILAGACLIDRMMTLFGARQLIVSDQGVRYGLLYERLDRR
jgi:exopolyphosphatase / guanosine-5'-triphosphate,3'-diphosphate pyrophosphatase